MSKTTPTVIVASSVLLREGIASVLQDTPYKVTAAVAKPTEVADHHFRNGRRALAIVGIEGQNEIDQAAESIRLLRSLIPDGTIVLVAETSRPVNLQSVLTLAPDGYILKVGSRDLLLKSFELIFMGQQLLVLGRPTAATQEMIHSILEVLRVRSPGVLTSSRKRTMASSFRVASVRCCSVSRTVNQTKELRGCAPSRKLLLRVT